MFETLRQRKMCCNTWQAVRFIFTLLQLHIVNRIEETSFITPPPEIMCYDNKDEIRDTGNKKNN